MLEKKFYANGQKVFDFDGDKLTYYYKNAEIKATGLYINDQMEEEWLFYRETGQLWQIGNFKNGEKHGFWKRFNKEGNVEYQQNFMEGKPVKRFAE